MDIPKYTLPKEERISRKLVIDKLFAEGKSFVVYPLRLVYLTNVVGQDTPAAMMVSVSKKRFKRAVKRNFIKRRLREAYRLNKHKLLLPVDLQGIAMSFIYLSSDLKSFDTLNVKMGELIEQFNKKLCSVNS